MNIKQIEQIQFEILKSLLIDRNRNHKIKIKKLIFFFLVFVDRKREKIK